MFSLLIVDGDRDFVSLFQSHAVSWTGISVRSADSEEHAEDLLLKEGADMVISGYKLPEKDGIALLKHIRARYGEIPFILLTAHGSEAVADEASQYGITGYFIKKGNPIVLFNKIYGMVRPEIYRKEKDQSLKLRESRCRSILELQQGFIIRISKDMKLIFCNKVFSLSTGLSPDYLSGRNFSDFIFEKDRDSFLSHLKELTPDYPSAQCMIRLVLPNEADMPVWTEWSLTAAFDPDGACALIQGIGRDVSRERESAEREEEYLQNLEFLSHTAMTFLDLEDECSLYQFIGEKIHEIIPGSIVGVNAVDMQNHCLIPKTVVDEVNTLQVFRQELGLDLIGYPFPITQDPSVQKMFQMKGPIQAPPLYYIFFQQFPEMKCQRVEEILSMGEKYSLGFSTRGEIFGNVIISLKKGSTLTNAELLEAFASQASVALLRHRTRNELRESEERYKAVVESQTDLICRFRPDGTHIFANDAFYRYFTRSRDKDLGKRFIPDMTDEDFESLKRHLSSLSPASPAGMHELRTIMQDDTIRWQQWNTLAIYSSGQELVEYQSTGRDITLRKNTEDELTRLYAELEEKVNARTKELQAANRELSMFSHSVSHDLRSPLRAIDGFSAIFLKSQSHLLSPESLRYIEMIRTNVAQMNHLIDSLFALSDSRRQIMNLEDIDMNNLAGEVLDELLSHEPGRNVEITLGLLPHCQADRILTRQVLVNLFSNALKYTRSKNPATIEMDSMSNEGQEIYYIRDNGIGFDREYADLVFTVFERLNSGHEYEGSGIGLAIVRQIVERHGGAIHAESSVGKGCTFYFTLS